MSEAERLNQILAERTPALAASLSRLGRRAAFPKGIPFQAAAAKGTRYNATIGQVTDGAGSPMPLGVIEEAAGSLHPRQTFLYSPQPGHPDLRQKWLERQLTLAGREQAAVTLPFLTHGLSHGLGLVADLFVDEDTTVLIPGPSWENYDLVFTLRTGARLASWPFYNEHGRLNTEGFAAALSGVHGKVVVVLNFPSNPTGYAPTHEEVRALTDALASHRNGPLVAVIDDAYQGVVFEPEAVPYSMFWDVAEALDPAHGVAIKVDGATKELLFFPSRVGFLTASFKDDQAEAAWLSKLNGIVRGTVGGPPGPSQALVLAALNDPERTAREFKVRLSALEERYRTLTNALNAIQDPRIRPMPFNGAFFAMVDLDPSVSADAVRLRLIDKDVGTVALPGTNALRIAYCSTRAEDLPVIVTRLVEAVSEVGG